MVTTASRIAAFDGDALIRALGVELDCTPSRLTNLRTARLADLGLVMRVTQWLGLPSSRFIHAQDH